MSKGVVKFFNQTKGSGIIIIEGSMEEIFVHIASLIDNIKEGDTVTFNIEEGQERKDGD